MPKQERRHAGFLPVTLVVADKDEAADQIVRMMKRG